MDKKEKIERIKDIISQNKHLTLNDIKRKVKKEFPDINIDELIKIITSNEILKNDEKEKGER